LEQLLGQPHRFAVLILEYIKRGKKKMHTQQAVLRNGYSKVQLRWLTLFSATHSVKEELVDKSLESSKVDYLEGK